MKQETIQTAERAVLAVAGSTAAWTLHEISALVAIIVGCATFTFIVVQLVFLLRKWYFLEKRNWKTSDSKHGDL